MLVLEGLPGYAIALIVLVSIFVLVLLILLCNIKIISQTEKGIIERLGSYRATWDTGVHFKVPFVDRLAHRIDMREQVKDFPPQNVITSDNVTIQIDTVVFYYVSDPKLYAYGVENPVQAIEFLSSTTLRNIIGELDLDSTLTSRDVINEKMRKTLDEATDPWGIKVTRVEVKNILPPRDIQEAMERQMRAEREKREKILLAEGQKQSAILIAEGNKESMILSSEAEKESMIKKAEGEAQKLLSLKKAEAEGIRMVREAEADGIKAIKEAGADNSVLTIKGYEALEKIADGKSTKIYLPSNLQALASTSEVLASAFKEEK
ncbi:MAG: SPFH/Band 7/PHB domain protein [Bacillales bacterium]|nr:SPFH/Band 7/PHB domain protein [Mollicutes bacterium]MCI7212879.1 SPFH/Band 7/PHB domain protein [Bacillales bacterium]MDD7715427.1 SPFH/Band 7/PHB domain protein [Mollicutes bacterium]MDY4936469.1 SPFH domain-containing protein [Candidatus Enteromonas sp.]